MNLRFRIFNEFFRHPLDTRLSNENVYSVDFNRGNRGRNVCKVAIKKLKFDLPLRPFFNILTSEVTYSVMLNDTPRRSGMSDHMPRHCTLDVLPRLMFFSFLKIEGATTDVASSVASLSECESKWSSELTIADSSLPPCPLKSCYSLCSSNFIRCQEGCVLSNKHEAFFMVVFKIFLVPSLSSTPLL